MPADRSARKILCSCCNRLLSARQEYRHRTRRTMPQLPPATDSRRTLSESRPVRLRRRTHIQRRSRQTPNHGFEDISDPILPGLETEELQGQDSGFGADEPFPDITLPRRYPRVTCEDVDEEDDDNLQDGSQNGAEEWDIDFEEDTREAVECDYMGRPLWEQVNEDFERDILETVQELSEEDIAALRLFALKVEKNMTDDTYEALQSALPDVAIESFASIKSRVAFLAQFKPMIFDCCINSCLCYTGPHSEETVCVYCNEPRFGSTGRARRHFTYIPLIPRLLALFRNPTLRNHLQYRHTFEHNPDVIKDVFDSQHYRSLLNKKVCVNGREFSHTYFSDPHDIALGASSDGFGPFNRRNKTCWPILIFLYNLPPELRFLLKYIMCVGVVPGPNKPKDFDSFLWPLVEELAKLAVGVAGFDGEAAFLLRAHLIRVFGDIPAVSMMMRMKGHNGKVPCRMCSIRGLRIPGSDATTHYVPLDRTRHPEVQGDPTATRCYDSAHLPLRTHDEFMRQAEEVEFSATATQAEALAKEYGIKGVSILSSLHSLSFPICFPYDFMHLIYENVIKNLVLLWTGNYKGLNEGSGSYTLAPSVWEAIGSATAASGRTIPSAFTTSPPNVANNKQACTADTWSFWLLYLGPVLLSRRFRHQKYYDHFILLVKLVHLCLRFDLDREEVQNIRRGFQEWVKTYEILYYQYDPGRLPMCPITIHALLHIADSIEQAGPVWTSWAFPMERYCGHLKKVVTSRRFPWARLDNHVIYMAQLAQVRALYNLEETISLKKPRHPHQTLSLPTSYPDCILLSPRRVTPISDTLKRKICIHFATRFDVSVTSVSNVWSSAQVEQWARVRRLQGGDDMYASSLLTSAEDRRDPTFVRYDLLVDKHAHRRQVAPEYELQRFYGQLQNIFVVTLPANTSLNLERATRFILAGILSCPVTAENSTKVPYYEKHGRYEVVDMTSVQCLIGRVEVKKSLWAMIDRSGILGDDPAAWGYEPREVGQISYEVDESLPSTPFHLYLLGSGSIEIPDELQNVISVHVDLSYFEFYTLMSQMDVCLPAFADNGYYDKQASSTVAMSLECNVPIMFTERTKKSYRYADDARVSITRPAAMGDVAAILALRLGSAEAFLDAQHAQHSPMLDDAVHDMLRNGWVRDKAGFDTFKQDVLRANEDVIERILHDL